jgi:hypothetical protein
MAITTDTLKATNLRTSTSPSSKCFVITPSDVNYLSDTQNSIERQIHTRAIMSSDDGNVVVIFAMDDDPVTLTIKGGVLYPFAVKMVKATGHTVTTLHGFR